MMEVVDALAALALVIGLSIALVLMIGPSTPLFLRLFG